LRARAQIFLGQALAFFDGGLTYGAADIVTAVSQGVADQLVDQVHVRSDRIRVVYNPMGTGRSAPIAPEDIAAVAVKVLREPVRSGEVLELTGGELSTVPEQVHTLSEVLGREVRCVDVPTEVAVQNFIRSGLPPAMAAAVGQTIEAVRNGRTVQKTDTVDRIVGRPPMTFAAWLTKHAARFA